MTLSIKVSRQSLHPVWLGIPELAGQWHVSLVAEAGIAPILPGDVPERQGPTGERLLFLLNYGSQPLNIPLPQPMNDLWSGQHGLTNVTMPPAGTCVLSNSEREFLSSQAAE